jgi:hypothetical protein
MKTLFALALTLSLVPSAFAAKKTASLDDVEKSVKLENQILADNELDCKVSLSRTSAGLVVAAKDSKESVKLELSEMDQITLEVKSDADGAEKTFTVAGVGFVRVSHVGDAFDAIEVSDGKNSVNCEVDY